MIVKSPMKTETDAKMTRVQNLSSSSPEIFGNDGKAQVNFEISLSKTGLNQDKASVQRESVTVSQWNQVRR